MIKNRFFFMFSLKLISRFFFCLNFSREEWQWLHTIDEDCFIENESNSLNSFKSEFRRATNELFSLLGKNLKEKKNDK